MTQLTIIIPDNKLEQFKQYMDSLEGACITHQVKEDNIFSSEILKMLDERTKTPLDDYIPAEEICKELKDKYSV